MNILAVKKIKVKKVISHSFKVVIIEIFSTGWFGDTMVTANMVYWAAYCLNTMIHQLKKQLWDVSFALAVT